MRHNVQRAFTRPAGLLALVLTGALAAGAQQALTQHDVEAAYLFRFASFLRLPPQEPTPSETFDICVLGASPLEARLREITAGEHQGERAVRVRSVPSAAEARQCAILFLAESEAGHVEQELSELRGADVLTVSSMPHFLERGGMIQFVLQEQRVRFAVNLTSVGQAGLSLSSELLRVAASVEGKPKAEGTP